MQWQIMSPMLLSAERPSERRVQFGLWRWMRRHSFGVSRRRDSTGIAESESANLRNRQTVTMQEPRSVA